MANNVGIDTAAVHMGALNRWLIGQDDEGASQSAARTVILVNFGCNCSRPNYQRAAGARTFLCCGTV
ncbi:MAG TPA: hypothetical protein H9822_01360, partial [Candidatus Yaniella excrementavium]|nr:hypothetical protein [Candidatus Yaniella excrementavium]